MNPSEDETNRIKNKTYYEITFVYAENGQQFGTGAHMNEKQRDKLQRFLEQQEESGCITDPQIFQPTRVDQGYRKALAEIKSALRS